MSVTDSFVVETREKRKNNKVKVAQKITVGRTCKRTLKEDSF